ncbi:Fic/DOC family N-terminal domain-containing protein [Gordonia sp. NPDC003585]|uniref:Fic family protein n=1 Tax=Gordonia sp. NPDC003585 TaxID=3154275 RepID=UPI0033A4EDC4
MTRWNPEKPYNALPPPPASNEVETASVLKAAISANRSLARLDQAAISIPNPTVLINTIPLIEAQASSEIENIVTTTDDLFRFLDDDDGADSATREALRYRTALRVGFDETLNRPITSATAITVCSTIKGHDMRVRDLPGTRLAHPVTGAVTYSPPEGQDVVVQKLHEWETYIHADDGLDPLIRMTVGHYQFEAIHPFADGNGRTGRILNILFLRQSGLLESPILYLSRYIIATKADYYRLLLAVTAEEAWEEWLLYMLRGVELSSESTLRKIAAIRELEDTYAQRAREFTRGSVDVELMAVLFEQPYCRISTVIERCGVSRPTATKWLNALAEAGLLEDVRAGRDRLFINRELLDILTRTELR